MIGNSDIEVLVGLNTDDADRNWSQFSNRLQRSQADISNSVKNASLAMSGGIIAGLTLAAKVSGEFEASLNSLKAATNITGNEFEKLRNQAKELGASTIFSASEAAQGMTVLGQSGKSTNEIYAMMPNVLNLATAGNIKLEQAAGILTATMAGFGLEAADSARITDVLAAASNSAWMSIGDFTQSMKYAAPLAGSLNVALEDTVAVLGAMQTGGLTAEMAGSALSEAMTALVNPTARTTEILDQYGVSIDRTAGGTLDYIGVIDQLKKSNISAAETMAIFGSSAGKGVLSLLKQDAGVLRSTADGFRNVDGAAQKMADTMGQGLSAQLKSLQSAWEGLLIAVGDTGILNVATGAVGAITKVLSAISQLPPPLLNTIVIVGGILAIIPPLVVGIASVISAVTTIKLAFAAVWASPFITGIVPWITGVAIPAIGAAASAIGLLPIAIGAVAGIAAYLVSEIIRNWDTIASITSAMVNTVRATFSGFQIDLESMDWFSSGVRIVQSIASGIIGSIPIIGSAMSAVSMAMDRFLPHSPAKEGALSKLDEVGGGLIGEIVSGLERNIPRLNSVLANKINPATPQLQPNSGVTNSNVQEKSSGNGRAPEIHITINGSVTNSVLSDLRTHLREFQSLVVDANRAYGT